MDDQSYNNRFYLKYSVDIGIDITTILYRILYLLIIDDAITYKVKTIMLIYVSNI